MSPGDWGPVQALGKCIQEINNWMCHNFLQLNKNKTEVIVFGAKEKRLQFTTELQSIQLKTTNQARNLGVVMDSDLNLEKHIQVRWPHVPGQSPFLVTFPWTNAVPENVPDFDTEWGKCAQTQSNTNYYGRHLTHRQRRCRMTYKRRSVNNKNLEAAKRK